MDTRNTHTDTHSHTHHIHMYILPTTKLFPAFSKEAASYIETRVKPVKTTNNNKTVKRAAGHYCTFTGCHYSVRGWQCGSFDAFCCFCHLRQVLPSIPDNAGVAENVLYGALLKVPEQLRRQAGLFYLFREKESLLRSLHQPEGVY